MNTIVEESKGSKIPYMMYQNNSKGSKLVN